MLRRLRSPIGRHVLVDGLLRRAWPVLRPAAALYRRTLLRRTRVIVVVGSFGKGSTAGAVARALGLPGRPTWRNTTSRVALSLLGVPPGRRHAVIEVGAPRRGQMRLYPPVLRPDVVVVTTIGSEHHRSLGTLDQAAQEKGQMLRGLTRAGIAVLNGDDPRVRAMAALTEARIVTFGYAAGCEVRAVERSVDWPHGTRLVVAVGEQVCVLRLRLIGRVAMYPILAALAVAWAEGRPLADAVAALQTLEPVPGRLQLVPLPGDAWLIRDDFKGTLETIEAALDVLAETPGRRIDVLGEIEDPPGSQSPLFRAVGRRLAASADLALLVGGRKSVKSYGGGAVEAGMPRAALRRLGRSCGATAAAVRAELRPGDVVLVKGRGTQRLERISLALQGRTVRCDIEFCNLRGLRCDDCPALATGWTDDPRLVLGR